MDWFKQTQETLASWNRMQRQMMDQWFEAVRHMDRSRTTEVWEQTVQAWESSTMRTLETQETWMSAWMEQLKGVDTIPEEARHLVQNGETMLKSWTDMQRQLWKNWFQVVRRVSPEAISPAWDKEIRNLVETWQETATRVVEVSQDMFGAAAAGRQSGGTKKKKGEK